MILSQSPNLKLLAEENANLKAQTNHWRKSSWKNLLTMYTVAHLGNVSHNMF